MNSLFDPSNGGKEACYGSGWDPTLPMTQNENIGALGMSDTSQFMHYSSDPSAVVFDGANLSGIVNSYNLPQNSGVFGDAASVMGSVQSQEDKSQLASPNGKRKRNDGGDMQRDSSVEISEMKKLDEKKQKIEESGSCDQSNKQAKDNCSGEDDSKGYIHMRARRGQATNSHSLAERVRREKINERMRLLQELVPGCNKITGKAVMLDEIINYVQSLQQQVEFLSMKLASVNPEINCDIEQILSKDTLHSRGTLGFNLGTRSTQLGAQGIHQGSVPLISNSTSLYHPTIPQSLWDGDLQNLHHMGFDPNLTVGNLGQNGS